MRFGHRLVAPLLLLVLAQPLSFAFVQEARFVGTKDPITGEDTSRVILTGASSGSEAPYIVWRCNGNTYDLFASPGQYTFLNTDMVSVQYRFDEKEASSRETWSASTDGTAAFAPSSSRAVFTSEALASRQIAIRFWDYSGTSYTHVIPLVGLEGALRKLSCLAAPPPRAHFTVPAPVQEVYAAVGTAIGDAPFTEGLNVLHLDGLTVTFIVNSTNTRTTVRFEGENVVLWKRILDALEQRY